MKRLEVSACIAVVALLLLLAPPMAAHGTSYSTSLGSIDISKVLGSIDLTWVDLPCNLSFTIDLSGLTLTFYNQDLGILPVIDGFSYQLIPGKPIMPVKTVVLKLCYYADVIGVNVDVVESKLEGSYKLMPSPEPKPLTGLVKPELRNDSIAEELCYEGYYPSSWVSYEVHRGLDPASMRRVTYLVLHVYPIRYSPSEGVLAKADNVKLNVELTIKPQELRGSSKLTDGTVDLLIITSSALESKALQLASWKESQGISTMVKTTDWIYSNYDGVDEPEKIRNFIKQMVQDYDVKFVLILGDVDQVPVRYVYIPDGAEDDDPSVDGVLVETDLYYADLDYTWDENGDGLWGDLDHDWVDGVPDVYVGRLPASNETEADILINKLTSYNPDNSWFTKYLLIGTDTFGGREGEILKDYIRSNVMWSNFSSKALYESYGSLTVSSAVSEIDKGYGFVNFAGHGYYNLWYLGRGGYYTCSEAYSQANENLSVIFAMACLTARYADYDCIGEAFLLNPDGGAIAYYGSSRVAWGYVGEYITYGLAGEMDWMFSDALFHCLDDSTPEEPYAGVIWGLALTNYVAENPIYTYYDDGYYLDWKTVAEYGTLLGDPSLLLRGTGSYPPLQYKVYGYVRDVFNGSPIVNAIVKLVDNETGFVYNQVVTDSQGYYELTGDVTNPGVQVYVEACAEGYFNYTSEVFGLYPMEVALNVYMASNVTADVLIVSDDDAGGGTSSLDPCSIASILESQGFTVLIWNESMGGRPSLDILQLADVVFWHTSCAYGWAVDSVDAETLIQFVESGGKLILEGEDIGFDHEDDEFMVKVAHAIFSVDDTEIYVLSVTVPQHPVTSGLPSDFAFSEIPPYPDGVEPTNGGLEVIEYKDSPYSAVVVYNGLDEGKGKVVYMAFPVLFLESSSRDTLILNSVNWLMESVAPLEVNASTDRVCYASYEDVVIKARVTDNSTPVLGATVTATVYDPSNGEYAEVTLLDDGSGADEAPDDGIYTGVLPGIPDDSLEGVYRVEVVASLGARCGSATTYFTFVGSSNLVVQVLTPSGEPAEEASITLLNLGSGDVEVYSHATDLNGIFFTTVGDGYYALAAYMGHGDSELGFMACNDSAYVQSGAVTFVLLNASQGIPLIVKTYDNDSQPIGGVSIDLYRRVGDWPLPTSNLDFTNESGVTTILVTPGVYHVDAKLQDSPYDYGYYLYALNVSCTSERIVEFNPALNDTSLLRGDLHTPSSSNTYEGLLYIAPVSLNPYTLYGFWPDEIMVTPDLWYVAPWILVTEEGGGNHATYLIFETSVVDLGAPSSTLNISFGGSLAIHVWTDEPTYYQGDTVSVWWSVEDEFGCELVDLYAYDGDFNPIYPTVEIYGPHNNLLFSATGYVKPVSYTIPGDAPDGVYRAVVVLDTDLYQGDVSNESSFEVGKMMVTVGPPGSGADFNSIGDALASPDVTDKMTILVEPGLYSEGMLSVQKNVAVVGNGSGVFIVGGFYANGLSNFTLANLTIMEFSIGLLASSSACNVFNVTFDGCSTGILVVDSDMHVSDCTFTNCSGEALAAYGLGEVTVSNSVFKGNGVSRSPSPTVLVVGDAKVTLKRCEISDGVWGILSRQSSKFLDVYETMITGCSVAVVAEDAFVMLDGSILTGNNWGAILYGSSAVDFSSCVISNNDYDGAVCYDMSGIYAWNTTIRSNGFTGLTLYDKAVFYGCHSEISDNQVGVLLLDDSEVSLYNYRVRGNDWGVMAFGTSRVYVYYSDVVDNVNEGIVALESSKLFISKSNLSGNGYRGLLLTGSSNTELSDSTVDFNGVVNGGSAVWLCDYANISIKSCNVTSNYWGIVLTGNSTASVYSCRVTLNPMEGFILYDNSTLNVSWSEVTNNSYGLTCYGNSWCNASFTVIANNTYDGVHLEGYSNFTGRYLNVTGNSWGIIAKNSAYLNVSWSNLFNNTYMALFTYSTLTAHAVNCWWGPAGPYGPHGAGAYTGASVVVEPFENQPIYW